MPTHHDETLLERYQREHRTFEGMSMSEHTPGKLAVSASLFDNEGCPETVIVGMDKNAFVAVAIDFGENNPNMRDANARRLVAAWNAFNGLETELIESMVNVPEFFFKHTELMAERDRLSAINAELLEALKDLLDDTQHLEHEDCEDGPCPVREARAAIAKAQGEQG